MRIVFSTAFDEGTRAIARAADAMELAQRQVASGRRVQSLSDDPLGAASAITEHATVDRMQAYASTNDAASYRLGLADNVLTDIVNQLTSAQTTALSARGSGATQAERDAIANEMLAIRESIANDINVKFQGTFLFGGSKSTTQPYVDGGGGVFVYQGNANATRVDVSNSRTIASTFDGGAILQGSDSTDVLTELTNLAAALRANDTAAIANGVAALDRAFDRAVTAQGRVGNDLRSIEDVRTQLADAKQHAMTRLTQIEDVNLAEASTRLAQSETAYRAALTAMATVGRLSLMDYLR